VPGRGGEARARPIATNRRARHDFDITETIEAGIALTGSEVKSLRLGRVDMRESYAQLEDGELYLHQLHIGEYQPSAFGHPPMRVRKLLVKRMELDRLIGRTSRRGMTLVALRLYFSERGWVKVELGVAKGRSGPDRRDKIRKREAEREIRKYG
jgi:SsrA-binding protein